MPVPMPTHPMAPYHTPNDRLWRTAALSRNALYAFKMTCGVYAPAVFGVLARAKTVKTRTLSLARLNVELAKLEAKAKATAIGTGVGLAAGAAVLVVYGIGFAISLWLSLLIVAGILFVLAAIAGFLAMRFVRKASPPTPEQALEEAARTLETFEGHV